MSILSHFNEYGVDSLHKMRPLGIDHIFEEVISMVDTTIYLRSVFSGYRSQHVNQRGSLQNIDVIVRSWQSEEHMLDMQVICANGL